MSTNSNEMLWDSSHRPWPLPKLPWVMRQDWHHVLFIHYPIRVETLRKLVPANLPLDVYDSWGWIGIIPFNTAEVRLRSIPWATAFPEVNVRTYITIDGKPGVYFFSLDATHLPTVLFASTFCFVPYYHAKIDFQGKDQQQSYRFISKRRTDQSIIQLDCSYAPATESKPTRAEKGSFDEWLTERYCFYTTTAKGTILRCDILHQPWQLQRVEVDIHANSLLSEQGIAVEQVEPVLHYSQGASVRIWPLMKE